MTMPPPPPGGPQQPNQPYGAPPPAGQQWGAPPPPPAPAPGAYPPPPVPGYGAPQGGSPAAFDPKAVNPLDWGIIGVGALTFIFSFFNYYTASFGPFSVSVNAWHGFFGWFGMLCAVAGSALVAISLFAPQVKLPVPARLAGLGLYAVALVCLLLAWFITPGVSGGGVDGVNFGRGIGFYGSLLFVIVGLVLSLMRFQQGGGKLPGALGNIPNIGGHGPR